MKKLLNFCLLLITMNTFAQLEPLSKYNIPFKDEIYSDYSIFKVKRKAFRDFENMLVYKDETIYNYKNNRVIHKMVYNKRFLFVFYFPENLKGQSFGIEILRLNQLEVIDLVDPKNKWFFDFSNLEKEHNLGLGFQNISKFDPTEGKLYFTFNFTYDEKSVMFQN